MIAEDLSYVNNRARAPAHERRDKKCLSKEGSVDKKTFSFTLINLKLTLHHAIQRIHTFSPFGHGQGHGHVYWEVFA